MLIRLSANRAEFKPVVFKPGFNAIVAERAPDSTDQDSRNARGKSTLLSILNYVLGGSFDKKMQTLADEQWEFTLELQLLAARSALRGPSPAENDLPSPPLGMRERLSRLTLTRVRSRWTSGRNCSG